MGQIIRLHIAMVRKRPPSARDAAPRCPLNEIRLSARRRSRRICVCRLRAAARTLPRFRMDREDAVLVR